MAVDPQSIMVPALFAGLVAIISTVFVERGGGALGGVITLPTTIVPASIGIWREVGSAGGILRRNVDGSDWHALEPPFPSGLEELAFLVWQRAQGNSLLVGVSVLSIVLWAIFAGLAAALVESASEQLDPMFIAILTTLASIALGFSAVKTGPPAPSGKNSVSKTVLMSRGLLRESQLGLQSGLHRWDSPSFPGLSRFSQQYSSQPWYHCGYLRACRSNRSHWAYDARIRLSLNLRASQHFLVPP